MDERRQHIRAQCPILVEFPNPTSMKTERSYTSDVSEGGLRFPSNVKLDVGQQIALALTMPFSERTVHTTGEVVWVKEIARYASSHYEVGVQFRWIQDPDRERFTRHLLESLPKRK